MELSYYKRDKVRENLNKFYKLATEEDKHSGKYWYHQAHEFCARKAVEYGFNIETVTSVLSALSPANKWERNLIDTDTVLNAVRSGKAPEDVKVCTYNKNKEKAFNIAQLCGSIDTSSRKTFAFVQNIAYLNGDYVTIDRWHLRAAFNKMHSIKLNNTIYDELQKITIQEAAKEGLKGFEYQAIIWEAIRNGA